MDKRISLQQRIIRADHSDPLRQTTFETNTANPIKHGKRIGGPKQHWTFQTNRHPLAATVAAPPMKQEGRQAMLHDRRCDHLRLATACVAMSWALAS